MRDSEFYLKSLADSAENLETFLHAEPVFWARGNLPSLSLGGMHWDRLMLDAVRRRLAPDWRRQFDQLEEQIDRVAERWRVAWERKAAAELRSRLNLWRAYLTDLAERPGEAHSYPNEVRNRLLAGYLLEQAGSQAEKRRTELNALDARLSRRFKRGEFIWDAELAEAFPQDRYWYLYGKPARLH